MGFRAPTNHRLLKPLLTDRSHLASFLRYLVTGGAVFALDFAVWITCVSVFAWDVRTSQLLSRTVGALAGFFGHKHFSFQQGDDYRPNAVATQGGAYTAGMIFNIIISPFVVYYCIWLVRPLPGSLIIGKLLADVLLVIESYVLLRIIFRRRYSQ